MYLSLSQYLYTYIYIVLAPKRSITWLARIGYPQVLTQDTHGTSNGHLWMLRFQQVAHPDPNRFVFKFRDNFAKKVMRYIPCAPCMEYLPVFGSLRGLMLANIPYIHGALWYRIGLFLTPILSRECGTPKKNSLLFWDRGSGALLFPTGSLRFGCCLPPGLSQWFCFKATSMAAETVVVIKCVDIQHTGP